MYEVKVLEKKSNIIFIKRFNNKNKFHQFLKKLSYSNALTILSIIDNSYMFD